MRFLLILIFLLFSNHCIFSQNLSGAETCFDIIETIDPILFSIPYKFNSTNIGKKSEIGDCDSKGASVWFKVKNNGKVTFFNVANASFEPVISYYSGRTCDSLVLIKECLNDHFTQLNSSKSNDFFYIKIEAKSGINLSDFVIEVFSEELAFDCADVRTTISRPQYPNEPLKGPFHLGEVINFSHLIQFAVGAFDAPYGNSCQWLQGIIPSFGDAWDTETIPILNQGPSNANWLPQDSVDYNFDNNWLSLFKYKNGRLGLKVEPDSGSLKARNKLPAGWWFTSNGSGNCTNDGDPDNMWGLPAPCNSLQNISFNTSLKVREDLVDCDSANLDFTLFAFGDGETGCWTNYSCRFPFPSVFKGSIICEPMAEVKGSNKAICNDSDAEIDVTSETDSVEIYLTTIDNPRVEGERFNDKFNKNNVTFIDHLINYSDTLQTVIYQFRAKKFGSNTLGPLFELSVKVYPRIEISFPSYAVCDGDCTDLTPQPKGGDNNFVSYSWSNGKVSKVINVCPISATTYKVTATDSNGCSGIGELEVAVLVGGNYINFVATQETIFSGEVFKLNSPTPKPASYIVIHAEDNPNVSGETLLDTLLDSDLILNDTLTIIGNTDIEIVYYDFGIFDDMVGCITTGNNQSVVVKRKTNSTIGILENSIKFFPNPASSYFQLESSLAELNCTIKNIEGKIVYTKQHVHNSDQFDIQKLSPGIYFIELRNDNFFFCKKLIKM